MYRRICASILALCLAFPVPLRAETADAPAEAVSNAAATEALKEADAKLAALAAAEPKDGAKPSPPRKSPAAKRGKKVIRKVTSRHEIARKKGSVKGRKMRKKPVSAKAAQVTTHRLSTAQVKEILATSRDFSGKDLTGLNLAGMDLRQANFSRASLRQTNLERADLSETDLEQADLSQANLKNASLRMARLHGTNLDGTRMDGLLWVDRTICKSGSVGSCLE